MELLPAQREVRQRPYGLMLCSFHHSRQTTMSIPNDSCANETSSACSAPLHRIEKAENTFEPWKRSEFWNASRYICDAPLILWLILSILSQKRASTVC